MEYKIGNKKVFVFVSLDCTAENYREDVNVGREWDAIILKENGETKMIYFEKFESEQECQIACEKVFKKLYPGITWRGF